MTAHPLREFEREDIWTTVDRWDSWLKWAALVVAIAAVLAVVLFTGGN